MAPTYRSVSPAVGFFYAMLAHFAAALQRLGEIPPIGWAWGGAAALVSLLWTDLFTGIFVLTVVATSLDHAWGVRVVRDTRPAEYDAVIKRKGRDQKMITLFLLLLVRGAEGWAAAHSLLDVGAILRAIGADELAGGSAGLPGLLSGLVCMGVFVDEMRSFHEHRLALGGRPLWPLVLVFGLTDVARAFVQGRVQASAAAVAPAPAPITPDAEIS